MTTLLLEQPAGICPLQDHLLLDFRLEPLFKYVAGASGNKNALKAFRDWVREGA